MFDYQSLQTYNDLEMLVYSYIMEHKEEVKYMTIRELADAVHVSTSTILRFCKKTGCDGYSEFKVKFKQFLAEDKKEKQAAPFSFERRGLLHIFSGITPR